MSSTSLLTPAPRALGLVEEADAVPVRAQHARRRVVALGAGGGYSQVLFQHLIRNNRISIYWLLEAGLNIGELVPSAWLKSMF